MTALAEETVIVGSTSPEESAASRRRRARRAWRLGGWHIASASLALVWLVPIILIVLTATRSKEDVQGHGVAAWPQSFTLQNFGNAWAQADLAQAMANSLLVTIPTVVITIGLAALAAFGLSRFRIPFRRTILILLLAANLLPVQVILIPIYRISDLLGIYDTLLAVSLAQIAFGLGFYVFVLYGFMRTIPHEIQDAASIDGAGPLLLFWRIILPLSRPALAAMAALSFTWVFNDLIWSISLLYTSAKFPITAAVLSLQGQYSTDWTILSSAAIIAALPCLIVFLVFQRSFVGGLALGAVK